MCFSSATLLKAGLVIYVSTSTEKKFCFSICSNCVIKQIVNGLRCTFDFIIMDALGIC